MKILSDAQFVAAAGIRSHDHRDFSLYDGSPYHCACGAIHKFYQYSGTQHYLSTGTKAKFMVQCPTKSNVVTLIETKNKFLIFFDRFVTLAGNIQQP